MSQNSNTLYINFLKKVGVSSFLQDKPNVFYKAKHKRKDKIIENINEIKNLDDLSLFIKKKYRLKFQNSSKKIIIGEGNKKAEIFIIGDIPEEINQGIKPFAGETEDLLKKMFNSINLNQNKIYIANIIPWLTDKNKQIENKDILECLPFIQRQIEIIRPKIILLMGSIASKAILNSNINMNKLRGKWHEYKSINLDKPIKCLVTYHPKDLIQFPKEKKYAWKDLQILEKKLHEKL